MSANWDYMKRRALQRQERGFATMNVNTDEAVAYDEPASTGGYLFVASGAITTQVVIGYINAPQAVFDKPEQELHWGALPILHFNQFFVPTSDAPASMAPGATVLSLESIEQYERGVMIVRMPRKEIFSKKLTLRTSELPRKRPRLVFNHPYEGENA